MSDWTPWRAIEDGDGLWDVVDSRGDLVAFGMTKDAAHKLVEAPELAEALVQIDALDPEDGVNGCSREALAGLVNRMGEIARAALAKARGEG